VRARGRRLMSPSKNGILKPSGSVLGSPCTNVRRNSGTSSSVCCPLTTGDPCGFTAQWYLESLPHREKRSGDLKARAGYDSWSSLENTSNRKAEAEWRAAGIRRQSHPALSSLREIEGRTCTQATNGAPSWRIHFRERFENAGMEASPSNVHRGPQREL